MISKRYLVTGGAGFIGSAVANELIKTGHDVVVVDNLRTGYLENIPKAAKFIEGDCQDHRTIEKLQESHFDAIFHIAGQSSGEISFEDPVYDLQTNTQSTLQLLQMAVKGGCKKFIFASTMSLYGDVDDKPINEEHTAKPKSFYAVGKLASEEYLRIFAKEYGISTIALRLFNVYGPGQNLENLKQGMVSIFLAQALNDQRIHVKGAKERFRDFVFIDDVVSAFTLAENQMKDGEFEIYNICSGVKTRVEELVNSIQENVDISIPVVYEGSTPGDQFGIYGLNEKAQKMLGWKPFIAFPEGIKLTCDWAKKIQS